MSIEAMKQALEALEYIENNYMSLPKVGNDAITSLRQAIAEAEKQERNFCSRCGKRTADLTVIHTCTPPQENT